MDDETPLTAGRAWQRQATPVQHSRHVREERPRIIAG